MGYRSDVAYIVQFESLPERDAYAAAIRIGADQDMQEALTECELPTDRAAITFRAEDVKWYEDFPDVKAHQRIYRNATDKDDPHAFKSIFRSVELGEDGAEVIEDDDPDGELWDDITTSHILDTSF